ncbi:hypothetical protein [Psychroserpens sp.]|uniref:hypothetical protein n=1 Tax=Psychroserpens sp. TaxID=2020870 RepID=UPI002B276169|nr:hypothetical protein [Psychroserpens sp.]
MNLFQQRKNKRFGYVPRHLRDSEGNSDENIKSQWDSIRNKGKNKSHSANRLVLLLIVLGMIIAGWYVLTYYEIS